MEVQLSKSTLILGLGKLHHFLSFRRRQYLLKTAIDSGFNFFDVAPSYGNGVNEYEIGLALKGQRNKYIISTKFGIPIKIYGTAARHFFPLYRGFDKLNGSSARAYNRRDFSPESIETSLNNSLKRLKTEYIDIFFLHEPIYYLGKSVMDGIFETVNKLIDKGKIRYLGISGPYSSMQMCSTLEGITYYQIPLDEISKLEKINKERIISYNIYKSFTKQTPIVNFNNFIKRVLKNFPGIKIILSTNSLDHLKSYKELF